MKQRISALQLIPSSGGVFEVVANGKTVYSKKATGQFPDPETIFEKIQNLR